MINLKGGGREMDRVKKEEDFFNTTRRKQDPFNTGHYYYIEVWTIGTI